jgi:hypothetical protein
MECQPRTNDDISCLGRGNNRNRAATSERSGCYMNSSRSLSVILLIVVVSLTSFAGCGGNKKAATPQQLEEHRQQQLKNADRERREG